MFFNMHLVASAQLYTIVPEVGSYSTSNISLLFCVWVLLSITVH